MNVYCQDLLQLDLQPAKFLGNLVTAAANQSAGKVAKYKKFRVLPGLKKKTNDYPARLLIDVEKYLSIQFLYFPGYHYRNTKFDKNTSEVFQIFVPYRWTDRRADRSSQEKCLRRDDKTASRLYL